MNQKPTGERRNSRAAQAAERHRIERKENERLDHLRKKQKLKAKRRTRKRISRSTWKSLLIMGGVVLAVVLSMLIFFRVGNAEEHILISGNQYYSKEEIIAASGVESGDNLLIVSRGRVAGNLIEKLPYISSVQVTRQLPDTLIIRVTEHAVSYAVEDENGDTYLITADGKAVGAADALTSRQHIAVEGITIQTPETGQIVSPAADKDSAIAAKGQFDAMTQLLNELEKAELVKSITLISVPSAYDLEITYDSRFTVRLGNTENLDYKLEYLKQVVKELADYQSGTIDLSFSEGSEARFTPEE